MTHFTTFYKQFYECFGGIEHEALVLCHFYVFIKGVLQDGDFFIFFLIYCFFQFSLLTMQFWEFFNIWIMNKYLVKSTVFCNVLLLLLILVIQNECEGRLKMTYPYFLI